MSIFGSILSKIFPGAKAAEAPAPAPAAPADAPAPAVAAPPPAIPLGDVAAVLDAMPGSKNLNWRTSIVDLMKLLDIDSSLQARKELATELGCPPELMADSAKMNMWLHKAVLQKLAANGGKVPAELLD